MKSEGLSAFSLADFYLPDSDDPLVPAQDFADWRREVSWASSLYEQAMVGGPVPRTSLIINGRPQPVINFASYNYLGLAKHPEVVTAAKKALDDYGVGACGSPILSGMTDLHRDLERKLSQFLGRPESMLFNSGFGGALGMLAGVLRKGDVAILDNKSHISLLEGAKLSGARVELFGHNNATSLDDALGRHKGRRRLIVTEGVFSMDGDMADLPAIVPVAEKHGVGIVIDEAHSILTAGANGRGVTEHFGLESAITLKYATFSKGFGAIGGFISGPADTLTYLRYFASSYGFSCALPPVIVAAILAALDIATRDDSLRKQLRQNTEYFTNGLHRLGLDTGESNSQVVPIIIGDDRTMLYELGIEMRDKGLFMAVVDYPSVPEDRVRYRASVTAAHTRQDMDEALSIIEDTVVRRLKGKKQG